MRNSSSSGTPQEQQLNAVIADYMKRVDAGQKVDQQSLLRQHPDLADGLRSYFHGEALMEDRAFAATKLGPSPEIASGARNTMRPGGGESDTASEFSVREFGRYQLLRPLGEGAMGSVFLAQDTTLDRRVALKMPKLVTSNKSDFLTRFTREARAAACLKHANICSVFDAGQINETAYITMDFIDGVPLSRFIGTGVLKSVASVLQMTRVIADAVGHAHGKGVIHRDLKPGNILVDDEMRPFVTDFGLARRVESDEGSRITQEGLLIGTPAYMAPEQVRGDQSKVSFQCDIYGLGVILFEMITCRLPFEGSVPDMLAKVLRDPPPIPSRLRTDLTEDIDDLVLKMLQKDPAHRYDSMAQVMASIDILLEQLKSSETVAPSATVPDQAKSPYDIQKAHIELMLKKGQYATAIMDLEKLAAETSRGAKDAGEWARKKLPAVRAEAKAMSPSGLAAMLKTAEQLFAKSDYHGCLQLLEDVPLLKRSDAMEDLIRKAEKRETEAEALLEAIRDKEHRQNPEGLEPLVRKLLKLKPGNAYAKRLWQALQTYSKTPTSRRSYRFEKGRLQPMPELSLFRQYAVLAALAGVLSFLSMSYYMIIYLKSGNQTLAVHVDDEWLKSQGGELTLLVDGDEYTITTSSATSDPLLIVVKSGEREFSVKHGDTIVHNPRTFTIERDGRAVLQITPTEMELRNSPRGKLPAFGGGDSSMAKTGSDVKSAAAPAIGRTSEDTPELSDLDRIATGTWIPLVDSSTRLSNPASMRFSDSVLELENTSLESEGILARDCVVQASVRKVSGLAVELSLRRKYIDGTTQACVVWYEGAKARSGMFRLARLGEGKGYAPLSNKLIADRFEDDQFVDLAIACVDQKLTVYVDGKEISSALDNVCSEGAIGLRAMKGVGQFKDARYQILEKLSVTKVAGGHDSAAKEPVRIGPAPEAAIAPFSADRARQLQDAWSMYEGVPVELVDEAGIRMRLIPPGEFLMGSPDSEPFRHDVEGPQHKVRLTKPYFMGISEITRKQWFAVMGTQPWLYQPQITEGDNYPVSYVDWLGATEFCRRISERTGHQYRLPTEAEWEYACRAGTTTTWHFGNDVEGVDAHGWFDTNTINNGKPSAQEVAQKKPNPFGLFDMHGNLFEWCQDLYVADIYAQRTETAVNPVVISHHEPQERRVNRSGAWSWNGYDIRSAFRGSGEPDFRSPRDGFRIVRVVGDGSVSTSTITRPLETVPPGAPAVAPFNAAKAKAYQDAWAAHLQLPVEYTNSVGMKFRLIPPGQFMMGSTQEQMETAKTGPLDHTDPVRVGRLDSEGPQHQVTLSKPFYLGVTEITQAQFEQVVGRQPSWYCKAGRGAEFVGNQDRANTPVEMTTWMDTGEFCGRLTLHEGLASAYVVTPEKISQTGTGGYRLPTEAEWEFACRAGTETLYWSGDHTSSLWDTAWTAWNSNQQPPKPVATRKANPFGLFDMHGNVSEWVHDGWTPDTYRQTVGPLAVDPRHDLPADDVRIFRGGNFWVAPVECRSANRYAGLNGTVWIHTGFRVAISIEGARQWLLTSGGSVAP